MPGVLNLIAVVPSIDVRGRIGKNPCTGARGDPLATHFLYCYEPAARPAMPSVISLARTTKDPISMAQTVTLEVFTDYL
jgi:hypothetical protein